MPHGETQARGGELGGTGTLFAERVAEAEGIDAADVALDSTTLVGTAETVQAAIEELDNGTNLDNQVQVLTPGAAVALDASLGHVCTLAMSTDATQTITISNLTAGQSLTVIATQNGAGSKALVFASTFFAGGTEPTMTTTAGAVDIYTIMKVGSQLYGFVGGQDLKT